MSIELQSCTITSVSKSPSRCVTVNVHSGWVRPEYWYVDGLAVPHTELGRLYLKAAYQDDVNAGFSMTYEAMSDGDVE